MESIEPSLRDARAPSPVAEKIGDDVASVIVRAGADRSDVLRARPSGNLRLLFPRAAGNAAWIVSSSLGGGLVDGDRIALDVVVEERAVALVTTQSSTKVYRGTAGQHTTVRVRDGGIALVVPDPVVPFRDASFTQTTQVDLEGDASLLLTDVVTAGRVASGERWQSTRIDSTLAVNRNGAPVLFDRVLLSGEHGDVAARLGRFEAIGTALLVGPAFAPFERVVLDHVAASPTRRDAPVVIAASPLHVELSKPRVGVLVRVAATRISFVTDALRALLRPACAAVGEDPWSRKW